jgi:hypothetical protein
VLSYMCAALQTLCAGAKASTPQWQEAVANEFDFRWCIKALGVASLLPPWVRHFDMQTYDCLYDLSASLYGDGGRVLPGHMRTLQRAVVLRHGTYFALQHQQHLQLQNPSALAGNSATTVSNAVNGESSLQWVLRRMGSRNMLRARCATTDVQRVLHAAQDHAMGSAVFFHDSAALSSLAMSCGVLMMPAAAAKLARAVTLDTAAWQVLAGREYKELQRKLRDAPLVGAPPSAAVHICSARDASAAPASAAAQPGALAPMPMGVVVGFGAPPATLQQAAAAAAVDAARALEAERQMEERRVKKRENERLRKQRQRAAARTAAGLPPRDVQLTEQERQEKKRTQWRCSKSNQRKRERSGTDSGSGE